MSYAAFGMPFGFGQVDGGVSADQMAIRSIALLSSDPQLNSQLSPLGKSILDITSRAITVASHGMSTADVLAITSDVAANLMPLIQNSMAALISSISADAAASGLNAISDVIGAIPLIGTFISAYSAAEAAMSAEGEAARQQAILNCQRFNWTPVLPGTGSGGKVVPADVFGRIRDPYGKPITSSNAFYTGPAHPGNFSGGTRYVYLPDPSVGQLFAISSEDTGDENFASPKAVAYQKEQFQLRHGQATTFGGAKGIPDNARHALAVMRGTMTLARTGSYDGGRSILPLYIDLYLSQLNANNITDEYVSYIFKHVTGTVPYHTGSNELDHVICWEWERRGIHQWRDMVRDWQLTVAPIYGIDMAALADLIRRNQSKIMTLSPAAMQALARSFAATQKPSLLLSPIAKTLQPSLVKALLKPPVKPVQPTAAAPKMKPATAVGLGAGAAILALLFFL